MPSVKLGFLDCVRCHYCPMQRRLNSIALLLSINVIFAVVISYSDFVWRLVEFNTARSFSSFLKVCLSID